MANRTKLAAAAAVLAPLLSTLSATTAHAQTVPNGFVWRQVSGCASAIGVGADNAPWILDCANWGAPSLHALYHRSATCDPLCISTWADAGTQAFSLAVDLNGWPAVTGAGGQVMVPAADGIPKGQYDGSGPWVPNKQWLTVSPGCVESFAIEATHVSPEIVVGQQYGGQTGGVTPNIWGIGCSSVGFLNWNPPIMGPIPNRTDQAMFVDALDWFDWFRNGQLVGAGVDAWAQVGAWAANAALDVTLFTQVTGTGPADFVQVPWARNAEGGVFYYSVLPQGGAFVSSGGLAASNITSLTDHYAIAGGQLLLYWTGAATGQGGYWRIIPGAGGNAAPIKQIAYSSAMPGTKTGTVGPSNLWAIDTLGNIYFAALPVPPAK